MLPGPLDSVTQLRSVTVKPAPVPVKVSKTCQLRTTTAESTVNTGVVLVLGQSVPHSGPWPGAQTAAKRIPKLFCAPPTLSCRKGAGTGLSVIQNSGQAAWLPCV